MSTGRFPLDIQAPMRGMNIRDLKNSNILHVRKLVNLRLGKYGNVIKRPGSRIYKTGFSGSKFYGFHAYQDSNNDERILTVNAGNIVEFNPNHITNRDAVTDNIFGRFVNAEGACFFCNGKENRKGLITDWSELGVIAPKAALTLSGHTTGGSLPDGEYIVKYSYVVKSGNSRLLITNHDYSATVTLSAGSGNSSISVSNIVPSNNPRVTHIIIWTTLAGGSALYLNQELPNGTLSAIITDEPDSTAALSYTLYEDNDGPLSAFKWLNYSDQRLWSIPVDDPVNVYPSNRGTNYDLEYFNVNNLVAMSISGQPLNFCFGLNGDFFAMTKNSTTILKNSDINGIPSTISENIGTEAPYSWAYWSKGIIGLTNRGIEYFDGYNFHVMSDDIYPLLNGSLNKETCQGFIYDDPEYGQLYQLGLKILSDVPGSLEGVQGYLPGSNTGGTIGLPSDNFDYGLNTTRWTATTGTGTITVASGALQLGISSAIENLNLLSTYTLEQSIMAKVSYVNISTPVNVTTSDFTQYLRLQYDSNNYAEIGLRYNAGIESIISKICVAGVVNTDTVTTGTTTLQTDFMIRLYHNRIETYYTDSLGVMTIVGVYYNSSWYKDGWKVKLGLNIAAITSGNIFEGSFDNLIIQCKNGTFENISYVEEQEGLYVDNVNILLTCFLRTWKEGIFNPETNTDLQPPWGYDTLMAQRLLETANKEILYLNNTTAKCYVLDKNCIFDDDYYIPIRIEGRIFDEYMIKGNLVKDTTVNKYCVFANISGNWSMPFDLILVSYPELISDTQIIDGYNNGTAMNITQMQNNALANTDGVTIRKKFKKMLGTAYSFIIDKMDADPVFAIETINTETNVARSRL